MSGDQTCALAAVLALAFVVSARRVDAQPSPTAEQLYDHGQAAYSARDYDTAVLAWIRSYDLSHENGLLFNLAQAYRLRARFGDCTRARDAYKRFIAQASDSPQRALAIGFVERMAACAARETVPSSTAAMPSSSHDTGAGKRDVGIAFGGTGVVLFATGLGVGHHASVLADRVTRACAVSCEWANEKSTNDAGRHDAALGYAFDAIGAIAILGGTSLFYLRARDVEHEPLPVGVHVQSTGISLTLRGSW
jgi:hypothetical protein